MPRLLCSFVCLLILTAPLRAADDLPTPVHEAVGKIQLPEGFQATLFAGEPDLVQPMAISFDDRGRMWVVECLSYPAWLTTGTGTDRITILEDKDGDGKFDTRKVFFDKGTNLSGIQLGFGGVWLTATPNLIFIPDRDGDDVPDGPPEVLLDGWDLKARHNVVNGLIWGPDGWLWGLNGILSNSRVGPPGMPDAERTALNCGVWRYHPTRKMFEVVASGTTNPWGLDFDDHGEAFITNCVIHHLFHVVPGAHYQRMFGQDLSAHSYDLLPSCADYIHWAGGPWQESRTGAIHDKPGGGHAHAGAMIYLGDNWPDTYRNQLFTCNIHGRRMNADRLTRKGSGYQTERAPDFFFSQDPWFRGLSVNQGPDGGVFVADWSDTGECHDYEDIHRETGRIFKVTYGKPANAGKAFDLTKLSDGVLVALQTDKNEWYVRHARRILQERHAAGKLGAETRPQLLSKLKVPKEAPMRIADETPKRLRSLWALFVVGGVDEAVVTELLGDADARVRSWAIRLELDDSQASPAMLAKFAELAEKDGSPIVRLALASGLQRLPLEARWPIGSALVAHTEDAADRDLPLMVWYGLEPAVPKDKVRAAQLLSKCKLPKVREFIARRIAQQ